MRALHLVFNCLSANIHTYTHSEENSRLFKWVGYERLNPECIELQKGRIQLGQMS